MLVSSHFKSLLSIALLSGLGALAITGNLSDAAAKQEARVDTQDFLGRWTVDRKEQVLTDRGKLYKTLDIVPCGKDMCGIAVTNAGKCGGQLFRTSKTSYANLPILAGTGKWGDGEDVLKIYQNSTNLQDTKSRSITINIGLKGDPMSRVGSMPMFRASYKLVSKAMCTAA